MMNEPLIPRNIRASDPDYPLEMMLVPNREQYALIELGGVVLVPLHQVIDALSSVKPNWVKRNGVKYCYNCGRKANAEPPTHGDDLRSKSDEELADLFSDMFCPYVLGAKFTGCGIENRGGCYDCWLHWLQSPADGGDGDG